MNYARQKEINRAGRVKVIFLGTFHHSCTLADCCGLDPHHSAGRRSLNDLSRNKSAGGEMANYYRECVTAVADMVKESLTLLRYAYSRVHLRIGG